MSQISMLVADDDPWMRALLVEHLRQDFQVRKAVGNGKQLFDAAVQGRVDVIVTDVCMPGLSGLDVMAALRLVGRFVPFVFVSARTDFACDCLARGAAAFVYKGDIDRELVPAVHAAIDGRTYVSTTARAASAVRATGAAPPVREPAPRPGGVSRTGERSPAPDQQFKP